LSVRVSYNVNIASRGDSEARRGPLLLKEEPGTRMDTNKAVIGRSAFTGKLVAVNAVEWSGIELAEADRNDDVDLQLGITNVRAVASQLGIAPVFGIDIRAHVVVTMSGSELLEYAEPVGYSSFVMVGQIRSCDGMDDQGATLFDQSVSQNGSMIDGSSRKGEIQLSVQLEEGFPDQFRPSEAVMQDWPLHERRGQKAEAPQQGTRLLARFFNIPEGVEVYATTASSPYGTTPSTRAEMIIADANGAGPPEKAPMTAIGVCRERSVAVTRIPIAGGFGYATWEVTRSDSSESEALSFGLMFAYQSQPGLDLPSIGSGQLSIVYAPVSTITTASASAPLTRFIDAGGDPATILSILPPTTLLRFPDVTSQNGFDTLLHIKNTGPSPGPCSFVYESSTSVAPPDQTSSTVASGETLTTSLLHGADNWIMSAVPNFTGEVTAVCEFRSAQGAYATVNAETGEISPWKTVQPSRKNGQP
jgi:hypothetical protein